MSTFLPTLDPHVFRAKVLRKNAGAARARKDAGFSLIEIMAGMAIIAILALAILPQFQKYFERANVQNLSATVSNAALTVESDYSLTGASQYSSTGVTNSLATVKKASSTALTYQTLLDTTGAAVTGTSGLGYRFVGTDPGVTNYTVGYCSNGPHPGLRVVSGGTAQAIDCTL